MCKRSKILGFCLILIALCASTANAQVQIPFDPGSVDECANQSSPLAYPGLPFDLVFTENKTLTQGPGELGFVLNGAGNIPFEGALLDAGGNEIPGTEYSGFADADVTTLDLSQSTTWHGMRFVSDFPVTPGVIVFVSCPVVGESEARVTADPEMTVVPDVTGDGRNEVALAREGSVIVEVRNGSNGSLRSNASWHADPYRPVGIISIPDINGNGQVEIAALGVDDQDTITLRVADGATNQGIRKFNYGSGGHDPIDLAAVSDVSGNGAADVAVLAVRQSDGRILVQIRDVLTGQNALGVNIGFLDTGFTPLGLAVLPNVFPSSSDELVVFATRNSDGRGLVEIREADGTPGFTRIWFLSTSFTPRAIAIGDDANNNGIPEIAMLAERDSDQRIVIERRDASGPTQTTRHWYFSEGWAVVDFTAVSDTSDADNLPEYAVLAVRSDGKPAVEIRNAGDPKATFRRFFMNESFTALQVEDFGDTNGNGSTNIGVLGTRNSDERPKLELRDVRGDSNTTNIWFAP